jgi:hypothetical protein
MAFLVNNIIPITLNIKGVLVFGGSDNVIVGGWYDKTTGLVDCSYGLIECNGELITCL